MRRDIPTGPSAKERSKHWLERQMKRTYYGNLYEKELTMPRGKKKTARAKGPKSPEGYERPRRPEKLKLEEIGETVQGEFLSFRQNVPTEFGETAIFEFVELTEGRPRVMFPNFHLERQIENAVKEGMLVGAGIWIARIEDLPSTTPGKHPAKQYDFAYKNPDPDEDQAPF